MLYIRHQYGSMLCIKHQDGLMLCIHGSKMCIRDQYGLINAVFQASVWLNVVQASIWFNAVHPQLNDVHLTSVYIQQAFGTRHKLRTLRKYTTFDTINISISITLADDTISTIKAIGKAIAQWASPHTFPASTSQLFHRIAISLWRWNASLWLHRLPTLPPSVDGII